MVQIGNKTKCQQQISAIENITNLETKLNMHAQGSYCSTMYP